MCLTHMASDLLTPFAQEAPFITCISLSNFWIFYTVAYADKAEAEQDPKKNLFNCAQRVHQVNILLYMHNCHVNPCLNLVLCNKKNTLEMYPIYSTFLLIGGIKHPVYASVAGVIFLVGRFFFSSGYLTGNPSKRMRGVFSYAALLGLLGMSVSTLYTMLSH